MKNLILFILFVMFAGLYSLEIGTSFSFRTPRADSIDVTDYEIALEVVTENGYLEIEKELENGQHFFNYEMKAEYSYRFKRKKYHPEYLEQKKMLEKYGESQQVWFDFFMKQNPPEIIETPFSIGLSTRTLEISSRDVKFSEIGLNCKYEYKASQIKFFLFRYISKGNYIVAAKNRWIDNETPEQLLVLTKSLKYKFKPIFDIDYALSYSTMDLKYWEKEVAFRVSADIYFFAVYFRYSLKEFGSVSQVGKMGISVKF